MAKIWTDASLPAETKARLSAVARVGAGVDHIDLAGRSLGVVGLGRIGRRVAEIARVLGMTDLACPRSADIVTLHVPLTAETKSLIGRRELARMKPGALLINTARGAIIDEPALIDALRSGRLAGAALDVWAEEPAPAEHPLLKLDNVVATPHIGSATIESRQRMFEDAAESLLQAVRGERPANLLNPAAWALRKSPASSSS